jgi:hypothetical protein
LYANHQRPGRYLFRDIPSAFAFDNDNAQALLRDCGLAPGRLQDEQLAQHYERPLQRSFADSFLHF